MFYIFGISGLLWCAWWERLLHDTYDNGRVQAEKEEAEREQGVETLAPAEQNGGGYLADKLGVEDKLPLRAFLREPAVKSLMYVHFCNNW